MSRPPQPVSDQDAPQGVLPTVWRLLYPLRFFWGPLLIVLLLASVLLLLTSGLSNQLLTGYTAF